MSRSSAALTSEAVLGPSARRCAERMKESRSSAKFQVLARRVGRPHFVGQQAAQELQRQLAGFEADRPVLVLVDHVVVARLAVDRASAAEGHGRPGHILQFDGDVLHHVAEPGTFVFPQPADEAAGFAIGAAVLVQARQGFEQAGDKGVAQARGRPPLQFAEVEDVPDDRKVGIDVRPDVDVAADDLHVLLLIR